MNNKALYVLLSSIVITNISGCNSGGSNKTNQNDISIENKHLFSAITDPIYNHFQKRKLEQLKQSLLNLNCYKNTAQQQINLLNDVTSTDLSILKK